MTTAVDAHLESLGLDPATVKENARKKRQGYSEAPDTPDRKRAEADFFWFAGEVVGLNQAGKTTARSKKVDLDPILHRQLAEFLQGVEEAEETVSAVLIPREHFKTSFCIAYVIWRIVRHPQIKILYAHGQEQKAIRVMREIKWHFEFNDKLRELFPDVCWDNPRKQSDLWLTKEINVRGHDGNKVPTLSVTSLESSMAGFHYDLILPDDIVHEQNWQTPEAREKSVDFYQHIDHLLLPMGRIVSVGTGWHWADVHGFILDKNGIYNGQVRSFLRGIYGEPGQSDGEPIFPAFWPKERCVATQARNTKKQWACQYLNAPSNQDDAIFKRGDLIWFKLREDGTVPTHKQLVFFTAVDPNRSEKTQHDPCVVMTAARDEDGHIWVVDVTRGWPSGPEIVDTIRGHVQRWGAVSVIVETNNFQLQLCNWLREDQLRSGVLYNIFEANRGPTTKKYDRISALEPLVAGKGLHLREGLDMVVQEMEHWPAWAHDDCLDALADIWAHGWNAIAVKARPETAKSPYAMNTILAQLKSRKSGPRVAQRRA